MRGNQRLILIVDDEERIVRVLRDYLSAVGYGVLCAYDGEQALEMFYHNSTDIDLILLDVMMPKKDGVAVLQELRETSLVPVIFLTAKGEEYDQIRGFRSGADDYIIKPFSQSVLHLRIEALLQRLGKGDNPVLTAGGISVDQNSRGVTIDGKSVDLTRREFDLLSYLMLNQKVILSRDQILNAVWGYDFDGDLRTVDTHVKQLRSKMTQVYAHYLKTVFRVGYRFEVTE
ncbi:response regulator transcription factor [Bengtsoniella intestinalis]|uniref:response regulator transcription factor n=1 Tax=Bengtsoniella intestinalis TaxID=3073143 RepID=UPI00391F7A19